jgi:hypothetical protein
LILRACVEKLHALPSVALAGATTEEMFALVDMYVSEQEELREMQRS